MLEELKAQTGALYLLEFLRAKRASSPTSSRARAYADAIVWAFGHISQGMYTGTATRKTYGNVAAIQIGFLMDHGRADLGRRRRRPRTAPTRARS